MIISEICIKRPVFASVLSFIIILIGLVFVQKLVVGEFPNIDRPAITVNTIYLGASPEIIETQITNVVEEALASVDGIEVMSSINAEGASNVSLEFTLETDIEAAANTIRDKIAKARDLLPDDADDPIVAKVEANSQPIIWLALSSDEMSVIELTDYADRFVKDKLQSLKGVAEVKLFGQGISMQIRPDINKMAYLNISPQDILTALENQNVDMPSGIINGKIREFTILDRLDTNSEEEFRNIIIKNSGAKLVRLGDIADIGITTGDVMFKARYKGRNAVALGLVKQSVANPVDISDLLRSRLKILRSVLPKDVKMEIAYDKAVFIKSSIKSVYTTIGEAVIFVTLVIFIFIGSFRSSMIPIVTIPISLIGGFALMYFAGFSINNLTLLAMVLAIGLVVDDAIVMLENIYRHIEDGMAPMKAAILGSKEIGFAVVAMTLTLSAVFFPVGLMGGVIGKLFTEFAWTLALTVIVSGFVALTLSPMMCSKLLQKTTNESKLQKIVHKYFTILKNKYSNLLVVALANPKKIIAIAIFTAAIGVGLFKFIPSELVPIEDKGMLLAVYFGREGDSIDKTDQNSKELEKIIMRHPDVNRVFMLVGSDGSNSGISFIGLKNRDSRSLSQQEIAEQLAPQMMSVPDIIAFPINMPSLGASGFGKMVQIVLKSSISYDELNNIAHTMIEKLQQYPQFIDLESDLKITKPRIETSIDRVKASLIGIDPIDIGTALSLFISGKKTGRFKLNGKQYDIITQLPREQRMLPEDLGKLYVSNKQGNMIPLKTIAEFKETIASKSLAHFNRMRAVTVSANLAAGEILGDNIDILMKVANEVLPPEKGEIDFQGQLREYFSTSSSIYTTFLLAILFIYLVLAAQFESYIDPFIILLAVPMSMTGGLIMLKLIGGTINIYSQIGLITLIGLVTKNSILIVEFTNQKLDEGEQLLSAIIDASSLRLRPIIMTTIATIIGAMPLMLASGSGAASRQSIGAVIVGGLSIGTIFTLFVIPVVCMLIKGRFKRVMLEPII
jgi:multidrug efflux pump